MTILYLFLAIFNGIIMLPFMLWWMNYLSIKYGNKMTKPMRDMFLICMVISIFAMFNMFMYIGLANGGAL